VGPHFDSYDVFLLQAHGQRKWRIGKPPRYELQEGVPLKILKDFKPEAEFVLNPGDMLYLPPGYAHDGVAVGECMTYSVGFRVPRSAELASELLMGLSEEMAEAQGSDSDGLYQDPHQAAAIQDASVPKALQEFAALSVAKALKEPQILNCLLGESLTEPKPNVWFDAPDGDELPHFEWPTQVRLDRRTKMLFDAKHIFINGESFRAAGKDAQLLRKLANQKQLSKGLAAQLSDDAAELMRAWWEEGWWHT
ncbi:MAG: JmjC domain-containing protein, partial [Limnohabitans sp.]